MNGLCSHERLERALAGLLEAGEETALSLHLDECASCSAEMERLSGGETANHEIAAMLNADDLDDLLPLREECSTADFVVDHLEPANDPGVLGRLGGYDVLDVIGQGGMGVVLKGFDRELKRFVAIKALAPHLAHSALARKRFAREAQAAAAVVNPHVIAIHQVQPGGQLPYLVMPLLTGESLAQRLKARGSLELKEILRIGMQAAEGLAAAHAQGLVHRDVKPANILLEKGVERVVITDFGLARAADDVSMTRLGVVAGTPEYMSPEQARGEALDGRSDLFSLGCVLYEMATGASPFRADSTIATLRRIVEEQPAAMASLGPELPPWFNAIVERLLSKDPAARFASADEVSELLEACLSHLQQPATVPLPAALAPHPTGRRSNWKSPYTGMLAMLGALGLGLLGMALWQGAEPPDIAGKWSGDEWGAVRLEATEPGEYTGSFEGTDESRPGTVELTWSRLERRFNGTWKSKEHNGEISLRLAGDEIRGAWTTARNSRKSSESPRLADLTWKRRRDAVDNAGSAPGAPAAPAPRGQAGPRMNGSPTRLNYFTTGHSITIACSTDGKLMAVANGNPTRILQEGGTSRIKGNWKPTVDVLDLETGKVVASLKLATKEEEEVFAATLRMTHIEATALAFSPAGNVVAVGTSVGQVKLFNARTGELVGSLDDERARIADTETPESWKSLRRGQGSVDSLAYSPDGRLLATCGSSFADVSGRFEGVQRLTRLSTGPGRLKVWEVESGTRTHDLAGHSDAEAVAFSPDGNLLASAGRWSSDQEDGNGVILWNPQTGARIRTLANEASGGTHGVVFSPDSRLVVTDSEPYDKENLNYKEAVKVTNALSGATLWQQEVPSGARPRAFSSEGASVVVLCGQSVRFLDTQTGTLQREIQASDLSRDGRCDDLASVRQGDLLAIATVDDEEGSVELWDFAEPRPPAQAAPANDLPRRVHRFLDRTRGHHVEIACSADGRRIAIANGNPTLIQHGGGRTSVADHWKPVVEVLDAETGKIIHSLPLTTDEEDAVFAATERISHFEATALAFSPDGNLLAVGTSAGQVKIFDAQTGELIRSLDDESAKLADAKTPETFKSLRRAMGSVAALQFSPDGRRLALCGGSFADFAERFDGLARMGFRTTGPGRLKLWDVTAGTLVHDLEGHNDQAYAIAFSPDGRLLASAGRWHKQGDMFGNGVIVWNAESGEAIHKLIRSTANAGVRSIAFSPDSRHLALGTQRFGDGDGDGEESSTGGVSLVQVSSGIEQWLVTVPGWANPMAFAPDGRSIAVLCGGRSIRFLDAGTGSMKHEIQSEQSQRNVRWTDFAIAPQGDSLAIGGVDSARAGSIEVWSLRGYDVPHVPAATSQGTTGNAESINAQSSNAMSIFKTRAGVRTMACSENGEVIAVANGGPKFVGGRGRGNIEGNWKPLVEILDAATGQRIVSLTLFTDEEDAALAAVEQITHVEVTALALSPDGSVAAVGTSIGQVKLFRTQTGEPLWTLDNAAARLADKRTPEKVRSLGRALGSVASLAFSTDGSQLAACGRSFGDYSRVFERVQKFDEISPGSGRLMLWDVKTGKLLHDLAGHSHANAVAYSPDGKLLVSAGRWLNDDKPASGVILWNSQTATKLRSVVTDTNGSAHSVGFSPDGQQLAVLSLHYDVDKANDAGTSAVSLANVASGTVQWRRTFDGPAKPVAFYSGAVLLLSGGQRMTFLDLANGQTLSRINRSGDLEPKGRWNDFAIARKGNVWVIGGEDGDGQGNVEVLDPDRRGTAVDTAPVLDER